MTKTKAQKQRALQVKNQRPRQQQATKPQRKKNATKRRQRDPGQLDDEYGGSQLGAVIRTSFPKIGMSDIRKHKISWILGYVYVGDGTNGAQDSVLLKTAGGTYLMGNTNSGNLGAAPILAADSQVGASYVSDIEKHFSRKVIKRMWVHVCSLQPSTANNMMAVVAVTRGPGLAQLGYAEPFATASETQQTFTNVISIDKAMTIDSFETKSLEVTEFIAGGSGPKQNEFEMQFDSGAATTVLTNGGPPGKDLIGICPASIIITGNNTTSALRGTNTHAIVVEQEVDLLDYLGGSALVDPVA